jgi:hypothetical protein
VSIIKQARSANQHGVAQPGEESAAGEIAHQGLVDRRAVELEVVEILGERQLGDGELVFDRARLLRRFSLISAVSRSPVMRCGPC